MSTLQDDLLVLTAMAEEPAKLAALCPCPEPCPPELSAELGKINWQRLLCFAIPIGNIFLAMNGLPPIPLPEMCKTPAPTEEAVVLDGN